MALHAAALSCNTCKQSHIHNRYDVIVHHDRIILSNIASYHLIVPIEINMHEWICILYIYTHTRMHFSPKCQYLANCLHYPILRCALADSPKPKIKHWQLLEGKTKAVHLKGPHSYDAKPLGPQMVQIVVDAMWEAHQTSLCCESIGYYFFPEFQDRNIKCVYDMACNLVNDIDLCGMADPKSTTPGTAVSSPPNVISILTESWPLQRNRGRKPSYAEGGSNR